MSTTTASPNTYEDALVAVERALNFGQAGRPDEIQALGEELQQLKAMAEKLRRGRIDIVVFGEINTGKSSLINALLGDAVNEVSIRGGMTTEIKPAEWRGSGYQVQGYAESVVTIVDTPGLNEVDGAERARIAQLAAESADLILFITDSDLNEIEFNALRELADKHKPLILVFNQIDKYSAAQRTRLMEVLRDERLPRIVGREDIVEAAADPIEREYVFQSLDGTERTELRKPEPNITQVKTRILEILERDGKGLLALNAAMFAADRHDKIVSRRIEMRENAAQTTIWSYAATKAIAVALNPVPAADVIGGSAVDIGMVYHLASIYGVEMNIKTAWDLVNKVLRAAGLVLVSEWLAHIGAGVLKGLTLGLSTVLTAIPQGAAAGYASVIVGNAAKFYFEHNASWGSADAKTVVKKIISETDKESVLKKLEAAVRERIQRNRHAKKPNA
jgi:small GTP-binding protein